MIRVLVQGICSYLGGGATQDEAALARKNLDYIDQELGAGNQGLLRDKEVHELEGDLAVVYYQLGAAVRALLGTEGDIGVFQQFNLTNQNTIWCLLLILK